MRSKMSAVGKGLSAQWSDPPTWYNGNCSVRPFARALVDTNDRRG